MTKKLILVVALFALSFQTTGCTSKKSQDDTTVVENADVDKIEAEDNFAANPDASPADSDPAMQAALGEASNPPPDSSAKVDSATSSAPETLPTDLAAAPTLDESSLNDAATTQVPQDLNAGSQTTNLTETTSELPPPTTMIEPSTTDTSMMAEAPPVIENSGANTAMSEPTPKMESPAKPAGGGLKKISETIPYKTAGGWVNAVYIARPGETLKDISQKIFAADKSKDIKRIAENSYLKSRSVKPGDKVYYVSPNRPDDSAKTLLYYEDMGMVPEKYIAKKGDNLKKVAKKILGYDKAYVEMWTANSIESKSKLNEGDTIRYWRSASGLTSTAMMNDNQKLPQMVDSSQMPQQPPQMTPPPQQNMAMNNPPPQQQAPPEMPPMPQAAAATTAPPQQAMPPQPEMQMPPPPDQTAALPPPPPPPPAEVAPPPPVEDLAAAQKGPVKKKKNIAEEESATGIGGFDENQMILVGAIGVFFAMLAFVLIKRKKKKAAEQAAMMSSEMNIG